MKIEQWYRLIKPHAGFDFRVGEFDSVEDKGKFPDALLFDEQEFVGEMKIAAKADTPAQPDFGGVANGKIEFFCAASSTASWRVAIHLL